MWSQIQRKLYEIIDPKINLQVHCAVYPGGGKSCANGIPRFWVTLDGEVIFDCMHDFMFMWHDKDFDIGNLPFEDDISWCCGIVIRHFQASVDRLMTLHDRFGLTDILLAADRRIGKRRWPEIYKKRSEAARKVLIARGYVPPNEDDTKLEAEIQDVLNTLAASNAALKSLYEQNMHLLKPKEIIRIHDAVIERFGGLKTSSMAPEEVLSKAEALVGRIRTAMTYNTAYDWTNVFLCAAFQTHCIARAHAFADGNKRTALNAAGLLLKRAGYRLKDSEALPELLVELAQDRVKLEDIAAHLKAEMTVSEKTTDVSEPNDPFAKLAWMKVDPQTMDLIRDFAEERTDIPTLCIIGSSRWLSVNPLDLAELAVQTRLLERHPEWSLVKFDCGIRTLNKEKRADVVSAALTIIESADLLHLRGPSSFMHGWPEDFETVMQALNERANAGKRTIVTDGETVAESFARYNRPVPDIFANALIAEFSLGAIEH